MPGPPPNPNAQRRNNRGDWRTLPARCERDAPAWPLGRVSKAALELWTHLWALPQAELWHEQNSVRVVARYVRLVLDAEKPGATAAEQSVVIRLEDGLLLTPDKLLKARCLIADGSAAPAATSSAATGTDGQVVELNDYRDLYG